MTAANEKRHDVLVGARVVDVRRDGGLVHLTLEHEDREDADATVLIRAPETKWLYPYLPRGAAE